MSLNKSETKKAALVLAHGKRHRNEFKFIIPIFRAIVNGISAGLIGLSAALLLASGITSFLALIALATGLAVIGEIL